MLSSFSILSSKKSPILRFIISSFSISKFSDKIFSTAYAISSFEIFGTLTVTSQSVKEV